MPIEPKEYQESNDDEEFDWTLQEWSNTHRVLALLSKRSEQGVTHKKVHKVASVTYRLVGKTPQRLKERQLVHNAEPYWAIDDEDRVGTYLDWYRRSIQSRSEREPRIIISDVPLLIAQSRVSYTVIYSGVI